MWQKGNIFPQLGVNITLHLCAAFFRNWKGNWNQYVDVSRDASALDTAYNCALYRNYNKWTGDNIIQNVLIGYQRYVHNFQFLKINLESPLKTNLSCSVIAWRKLLSENNFIIASLVSSKKSRLLEIIRDFSKIFLKICWGYFEKACQSWGAISSLQPPASREMW